jgi:choline monooxygenase
MEKETLKLNVEEDIRRAETLPGKFYGDREVYERAKEKIFARSWQFITHTDAVRVPGQVLPFTFLEGSLDEPLLFTRDNSDRLHCMSNVCTHRGMMVCEHAGVEKSLRCRYHGRKFALDGTFQSMPECEDALNFPRPQESLPRVKFDTFSSFLFASLDPAFSFDSVFGEMKKRIGWMPIETFKFDPSTSRDYLVQCNWALYCENYLEGFHIPYVHAGLNNLLDYSNYSSEIYEYSNLQLGVARSGESCFDLPSDSPDYGRSIGAYYYWLFPNLMFNFYPWGLSINVVKPLGPDRTRVSFLTYVWDQSKWEAGADKMMDRVEREDEAIVEAVNRGVKSRLYTRGRFSPKREQGCHHFHRLLSKYLS